MSVFDEHKHELEHCEQMMGTAVGWQSPRPAYQRRGLGRPARRLVPRQPRPEKPTMDIQLITQELREAKELIRSVVEELCIQRENQQRLN
jgi:hypothetical protein